jgi:DNA repair protein RAD50
MFKSLDAVVQNYNKETGEKQALTYKCADINTTVPALMGVSKVGHQLGGGAMRHPP